MVIRKTHTDYTEDDDEEDIGCFETEHDIDSVDEEIDI